MESEFSAHIQKAKRAIRVAYFITIIMLVIVILLSFINAAYITAVIGDITMLWYLHHVSGLIDDPKNPYRIRAWVVLLFVPFTGLFPALALWSVKAHLDRAAKAAAETKQ